MPYVGVDLGGTQIRTALANEQGFIMGQHSAKTVQTSAEALFEQIVTCIEQVAEGNNTLEAIGVGTAGRVDPLSGSIVYATGNLPGWTGFALGERLQARFGVPVQVDNDVNAAAVGEGWLGSARNCRSYLLVFLGTGAGGAYVEDGRLIHGNSGGALEIGHMLHQPGGRRCNCGQCGCWETYVSGTALDREARSLWGDEAEAEQLFRNSGAEARRVIDSFVRSVAEGLVSLQQLFDPEKIIIGGGVADSYECWEDSLWEWLPKLTPHEMLVERAVLGGDSGMLGAIAMAINARRKQG